MHMPSIAPLLALAGVASAATVTYDWNVEWVNAAPDGFERPVIGINGAWPCPSIEANLNDTVIVNLHNNLGNETTGLHFHGIRQFGSPEMDGPVAATQCSLPPGSSVSYQFVADTAGTYWYHSHEKGQYPDGLRGPLIIRDPEDPYNDQVDEEMVLTVSDWYHNQSIPLVQNMLLKTNTHFIPPFPDNIIFNEGGNSQIPIEKGKTYRFRIINYSALAAAFVNFEFHTMKIIAQDGDFIQPVDADQIRIGVAQRYDVLLEAKKCECGNIPFIFALDTNADFTNPNATALPIAWNMNATGTLVLNDTAPTTEVAVIDVFNPVDDATFSSFKGEEPWGPVAQSFQLDFNFCLDSNEVPRACFNNQSYVQQLVPTLYSVATTGTENTNPAVYGAVNPYIVEEDQVIEIIVNNIDAAIHPFHLHGHSFQVIERPASGAGLFPGTVNATGTPATKDTISVNGDSYAVIRFKTNNPGVWLFHCHIEWHVEMGLTATFIESPEKLRGRKFPKDHIDACKAQGIPFSGNAAGNTKNFTDTTGMLYTSSANYSGALYVAGSTTKKMMSRMFRWS